MNRQRFMIIVLKSNMIIVLKSNMIIVLKSNKIIFLFDILLDE